MCIVDDWFTEHRAFAMGLVSTGAPLGGILFSLVLKALFCAVRLADVHVQLSVHSGGFYARGLCAGQEPRAGGRRPGAARGADAVGFPAFPRRILSPVHAVRVW